MGVMGDREEESGLTMKNVSLSVTTLDIGVEPLV